MHKKFISLLRKRKQKLRQFGFETYEAYLASPHWIARREAFATAHPPACPHCTQAPVIHHNSYDRLGQESDDDLGWLCHDHHDEMHKWGEIVPATSPQQDQLRSYGFGDDVIERLTRGVAYRVIDDIFNGRRRSPNSLPPKRPTTKFEAGKGDPKS